MATEKRLIDANALMAFMKDHYCQNCNSYDGLLCGTCSKDAFMCHIETAPTVDAVEVVHGEWEITEDDYFDLVELKCSACGEAYGFEDYEDCMPKNYHYCPNCGAKMDGDGNG